MLQSLTTLGDLLLVIFGFGAIIFIHELGHFLAAKWAGIRVHEFAIGFGPAIASYRRGIGVRSGSTWSDVQKRRAALEADPGSGFQRDEGPSADAEACLELPPGVGVTEYRLNWLPLGGYVKMLGQEDLDPSATSTASDSYASKSPGKRMVVISAGVVMNLILAALLFIIVFMMGLSVSPPVIGAVDTESPAASVAPINAASAGVDAAGLQPGDKVTKIRGKETNSFKDIFAAAGLAEAGQPLRMTIARPGVDEPLIFEVTPEKSERTRLLELGVYAATSTTIAQPADEASARTFDRLLDNAGLGEIGPGWTITEVNGDPVSYHHQIDSAFARTDGHPVALRVRSPDGALRDVEAAPRARLQTAKFSVDQQPYPVEHLLGLCPPMRIESTTDKAHGEGLRAGDIVVRIDRLDWPNTGAAIREIRGKAGRSVAMTVLRGGEYVDIEARVGGDGRIGFTPGQARDATITSRLDPSDIRRPSDADGPIEPFAASSLDLMPGSMILSVDGVNVSTYTDLRAALRSATQDADASGSGADVQVRIRLPLGDGFGVGPIEEATWSLSPSDVATLHELGWSVPLPEYLLLPAQTEIRTANPIEAISIGLQETRRVVAMTYITLLRLFEGSVKVEHLKGPVGIAHIGTQVAEQGFDQLLFFLAIISVNLAVLNFLPLPIVDGGHAVFILIEWMTGRPVSVAVQNIATLIGLALLGGLFLVVTYHDLVGLFGG